MWGAIAATTGAQLVGDYLNNQAAEDEGRRNRQFQADQTTLVNKQNADLQREFAKNGIRWRVQDAESAGLHPLAALGAVTPGATPSFQIGDTSVARSKKSLYGTMANTLGQNISRAVQATSTQDERIENRLRQENMGLQNDLLRRQILNLDNPNNPPMPVGGSPNFMGGQGDSGVMLVKPSERTASAPGRPAQEAGWRPDVSYSRTDSGLSPVIPQGLSESMEDDMVGKVLWRMRNQVMPNFGEGGRPPSSQLPRGATRWRWSHSRQEWQPAYGNQGRTFWDETLHKFIDGPGRIFRKGGD